MPEIEGLYYETHGPDDGPPVILSPGLGGSAAYWAPNLEALAAEHRVILYDHRGTGRSDRSPTGAFPMLGWARDLLFLAHGLDLASVTVIGHAAGGLAGLVLAAWRPELVERLVVVNGWLTPDPHTQRCFEARLALLRNSGPEAYLRAQPIFLYPANWASDHSDRLDAELPDQLAVFPDTETVEHRISVVRAFNLPAQTHSVPTLVVAAADDMLVPSHCSEQLAAGLKNARLSLMDWGGHACNVTDPDGFNQRVLDFLRS